VVWKHSNRRVPLLPRKEGDKLAEAEEIAKCLFGFSISTITISQLSTIICSGSCLKESFSKVYLKGVSPLCCRHRGRIVPICLLHSSLHLYTLNVTSLTRLFRIHPSLPSSAFFEPRFQNCLKCLSTCPALIKAPDLSSQRGNSWDILCTFSYRN
jgi:hypothetical protein